MIHGTRRELASCVSVAEVAGLTRQALWACVERAVSTWWTRGAVVCLQEHAVVSHVTTRWAERALLGAWWADAPISARLRLLGTSRAEVIIGAHRLLIARACVAVVAARDR